MLGAVETFSEYNLIYTVMSHNCTNYVCLPESIGIYLQSVPGLCPSPLSRDSNAVPVTR